MANEVDSYLKWIDALKVVIPEDDWDGTDKEKLIKAAAKVIEAKYELLQATNQAELEKFSAAQDLKNAYAELAYLSGKYKTPPWEQLQELAEIPDWLQFEASQIQLNWSAPLNQLVQNMRKGRLSQNLMFSIPFRRGASAPFESFKSSPLESIDLSEALRWLGDLGVVVVSFAAAAVLALQSFYVDKTFGTGFDYLLVILGGTAIQTSVSGIKTLLTNLVAPLKS
jgi:hypothetical protein